MRSEQDIYQAILREPDRDDLLLEYAALLAQRGAPQAELIETQVALASASEDDETYPELKRREAEVLKRFGKQIAGTSLGYWPNNDPDGLWRCGPLYEPADAGNPMWEWEEGWSFQRGLIRRGHMHVRTFLANAEALFQTYPVIALGLKGLFREAEIPYRDELSRNRMRKAYGLEDYVGPLAISPYLLRLKELSLQCEGIGDPGIRTLVCSHNLAALEDLGLTVGRHPTHVLDSLAGAPSLARLKRLTVRYNDEILFGHQISSEGLRALGNSPFLESLTSLKFHRGRIGPAEVEALAASPLMARLQELRLTNNPLGEEGFQILAHTPALMSLSCLDLSNYGSADEIDSNHPGYGHFKVGEQAAIHLGASHYLNTLQELNLSYHSIGDTGLIALLTSPSLKNLTRLELNDCNITEEGVIALARSPHMAGLAYLGLSQNAIKDRGAEALAASPYLAGLKKLSLAGCELTDRGIEALGRSPYMTRLNHLAIDRNIGSKQGLITLIQSSNTARLRTAYIGQEEPVSLGENGVRAIAESPYLTRLNILSVGEQNITLADARRLVESRTLRSLIRIGGLYHSREGDLMAAMKREKEIMALLHSRWPVMPEFEDLYEDFEDLNG